MFSQITKKLLTKEQLKQVKEFKKKRRSEKDAIYKLLDVIIMEDQVLKKYYEENEGVALQSLKFTDQNADEYYMDREEQL